MRKILLILPVVFFLYACPFESPVPLEEHPVEQVDSSLFGYWYGIVKDGSDFFGIEALDIKQETDSVYSIIRYGKAMKGDMILPDTSYFKGYISYLNGERYMNVATEITVPGKKGKLEKHHIYYLATIRRSNDTIFVKTVTDGFSPNKRIFRSRDELLGEINKIAGAGKNIFDDLYTLSYKRIRR